MSGIFGRTVQPTGTADALIGTTQTTQSNQEEQGGGQSQQQNQGVPPFEGNESGNVSESEPSGQNGNSQQNDNSQQNNNSQEGDQNQQQGNPQQGNPQQSSAQFDPAAAYAIQVANEAKVAAQVAQQLAQHQSTPVEEDTFEEITFDDVIDEEELVSDGEKKLVSFTKKLVDGINTTRKELHETKKQLQAAEDTSERTNTEFEIQRAMQHYNVTRAELESAFQRSNGRVQDVNILAESALYARIVQQQNQQQQEQVQTQVQEATENRGKNTGVVGQQQSSNSNNGTSTTNTDEPRGGGKLNPFDGASIAQHYSAFA